MTQRYTPSAARRVFIAITLGVAFQLSACHQAPPPDDAKSADAKATPTPDAKAAKGCQGGRRRRHVDNGASRQTGHRHRSRESRRLHGGDFRIRCGGASRHHCRGRRRTDHSGTDGETDPRSSRPRTAPEGTPGALSAEVEETASRQSAADAAAQVLAAQRLSAIIGLNPAWKAAENTPMLQELASGKSKLLRATFPLGTVHGPSAEDSARGASRCHPKHLAPGRAGLETHLGMGCPRRCQHSGAQLFRPTQGRRLRRGRKASGVGTRCRSRTSRCTRAGRGFGHQQW
jgi:hypothetical protein